MKCMSALGVAAVALACTGASAQSAGDIEGKWMSEGGHAIFDVSLCGDGTQLCAKLSFLRDDAVAPLLEPFIGQTIITEAEQVETNRWAADTMFWTVDAGGTVTLLTPTTIKAVGCMYRECRVTTFYKIQL